MTATPDAEDPLPRLREICLSLPEAAERVSHGTPTWFARRTFVMFAEHHHGHPHVAFWCAAPPGVAQEMIAAEPARFFRPAYVGHRGWLGVVLDGEGTGPDGAAVDWDEITGIVTEAYRTVAPKKLLARLDDPAR
ncbi:MmcQ/YjbR family DNA-binding protein [Pseudonocardia sp. KRD291]|uniref:MmcQ/YjbR family DNA-binding protein n=1 Tax=Pseudonocardia sp. KRD291 TaxID=2792007 RepID=UPI001C4A3D5F|nr:MmcQ/YjbR family DNA-binding protein [Pseudonocardia sp. KRD291]MBW0104030.1 MmcQ/YjbR family DNA-binding protein [Pseudonocardia sp. KRD291]